MNERVRAAWHALALATFASAWTSACAGSEGQSPSERRAALGGEAAARIGSEVVPVGLVGSVASAQKISPREALERLVDDAVAADAARARGHDRKEPTSWRLTSARARLTADRLLADAKAAGPPTDAEVATLTDRHWREVDRPPAVRVVHVVVCAVACSTRSGPKRTPESREHARATVHALRSVLAEVASAEEFKERAKSFLHPSDVEVLPQDIDPMTQDGRDAVAEGAPFDPAFAAAAFAVAKPGDTSPVVETQFGWHVIRLIERLPERRMSFENRRAAFTEEAYAMRAAAAKQARIDARRTQVPIAVSASAEQLMRSVTNPASGGGAP